MSFRKVVNNVLLFSMVALFFAIGHAPQAATVTAAEFEDPFARPGLEGFQHVTIDGRGIERHQPGHDLAQRSTRMGGMTSDQFGLGHDGPAGDGHG